MPGVGEIAHATLLPPPVDDPALSEAQRLVLDRVLLLVRTGCVGSSAGQDSQAWIWNPVAPRALEVLPMHGPGLPAPDGNAADPFCCGMTHLADGDAVLAGGLNYPAKCATSGCVVDPGGNVELNMAVGHKYVYRLDVGEDPPRWLGPADGWPKFTQTETYYPTLVTRETGNPLILGSAGAPTPTCPVPYASWPPGPEYEALIPQMREEYDAVSGSFARLLNRTIGGTSGCSSNPADVLLNLHDYPRAHVTGSGWLVVTNSGFKLPGQPFVPSAQFMDLQATCPPADWRFLYQTGAPAALDRDGGSSVQIEHSNEITGLRESLLYVLGGTQGDDDDITGEEDQISASVQKMVVSGPSSSWVTAPPLDDARVNHNTVMLPNGVMAVIGGIDDSGAPVRSIGLYRPPELFPGDGLAWVPGPAQFDQRPYHSAALLLRDGRVISVGGAMYSSYHTLEIYAPEYYFSTIRPSITDWPKPTQVTIRYLSAAVPEPEFEVYAYVHHCPPVGPAVKRVVLIRPGTCTHAFDCSQRYVELTFTSFNVQTANEKFLVVEKPTKFEAPPGYYMLFVVDERDRPSIGQWVRIDE